MQPHIYRGSMRVCMTCFKPANDPLHIHSVATPATPVVKSTPVNHAGNAVKASNSEPAKQQPLQPRVTPTGHLFFEVPILPHVFRGKTDICEICLKHKDDSKHDQPGKLNLNCAGHVCAKCATTWHHEERCANPKQTGLCKNCAQESAALINRSHNIQAIAEAASSSALTNREIVELSIEHEGMIKLSILKRPDGTDNPNWQEDLDAHRLNIRKQIEKLRAWDSVSLKIRADKQTEELTKLTPEELEQYKRDARKPKKSRVSKSSTDATATVSPKVALPDKQKAHSALLKSLIGQIVAKKPGISAEDAEKLAQKRLDILGNEA